MRRPTSCNVRDLSSKRWIKAEQTYQTPNVNRVFLPLARIPDGPLAGEQHQPVARPARNHRAGTARRKRHVMTRIAIQGFGPIGRSLMRVAAHRPARRSLLASGPPAMSTRPAARRDARFTRRRRKPVTLRKLQIM